MSRVIKYRGKRVDSGAWVYGYFFQIPQLNLYEIFTGKLDITTGKPIRESYEVIPETVGQYIGIEDDNKKEIYEGDIYIDEEGYKYTVKIGQYDRPIFQGSMDEISYGVYLLYENGEIDPNLKLLKRLKYISNTYDNPEFLQN